MPARGWFRWIRGYSLLFSIFWGTCIWFLPSLEGERGCSTRSGFHYNFLGVILPDSSMAKLTFPYCNRYTECRSGCAVQQLLLLVYVVPLAGWSNNHNGKPSFTGLVLLFFFCLLAASAAPRSSYSPVTVTIRTFLAWTGHWTGLILHMHWCRKCWGKRKGALDLGTAGLRQHCCHIYSWFVGSVVHLSSEKLNQTFHFDNC